MSVSRDVGKTANPFARAVFVDPLQPNRVSEFLSRIPKICPFQLFFSAFDGAVILGAKKANLRVQDSN